MYTEEMKKAVQIRLAVNKYAGCSVLYWDRKQKRVVATQGIAYWNWVLDYYCGYGVIACMSIITYNYSIHDGLPEESQNGKDVNSSYRNIQMYSLGGVAALITLSNLIVSILKEERHEIVAFYNGLLDLDERIKEAFREDNTPEEVLQEAYKSAKIFGHLATFCTTFTIAAPFFMFLTVYYLPVDPQHIIIKEGLELEVTPSVKVLLVNWFLTMSTYLMVNTFMSFIYAAFLAINSCVCWIAAITPTMQVAPDKFETERMGVVHIDRMIWLYRCEQVVCIYLNAIVAKMRIGVHHIVIHVIFIVSTFLLIKNLTFFWTNGRYDMIFLFFSISCLTVFFCKAECKYVTRSSTVSADFKDSILTKCRRKLFAYKGARSLNFLDIRSTHPFYTLGDDSYLEFWDVCVDHIVSLLSL